MLLTKLKQELLAAGKFLVAKNLVAGTWGNLSVRLNNQVIITPSGSNYNLLTIEDLVVVDLQGQILSGNRPPSSELACHLAVYNQHPQLQAVVHTHSLYASACAAARRPIPAIIEDLIQIVGGDVAVATYALPGTAELANNLVTALADKSAVLLANHGVVTCGISLNEALLAAEIVEKAAQIFILAQQLGGGVILPPEDIAIMRNFYLAKYRKLQEG